MRTDITHETRESTVKMATLSARCGAYLSAVARATVCLLILSFVAACASTNVAQLSFDTPEQAVQALIKALRNDEPQQVLKLLGPEGERLVYSGDPVADKLGREKFVTAYDDANEIARQNNTRAVLIIGNKQWPFPIPIVKAGTSWHFDTPAGVEEILDRRIGRNELQAIQVCLAYVDAQREYATQIRGNDERLAYAQHFMSSPGEHNGLYWPTDEGEPQSPMGPLVAAAQAEGYTPVKDSQQTQHHSPYHGYFYRILTRQGPHAADGARDYLVDGSMIGGFALVAFPARYGDSGIMTFIVNQDGIVYQKNLGQETEAIARQVTTFDPDSGWTKAPLSRE